MIKNGYLLPFKVVNNIKVDTPFNTWTLYDKELAKLNARCMNYFFHVLKSDDYM